MGEETTGTVRTKCAKCGSEVVAAPRPRHRVACGDSTDSALVARLLGSRRLAILASDPPYGMALDPRYDSMHSSPDHRITGERFQRVVGDDKSYDPRPAMVLWAAPEEFWWGADYYRAWLPDGGSWLVWDKRDNDAGMALDSVIGSMFELAWSKRPHRREILRVLWSGHHGMQHEDARVRLHPTQKPTRLIVYLLEQWSPAGCLVGDPYLGFGTTLIAAASSGRTCYGSELLPSYVDVIRRRFTAWARSRGLAAGPGRLEVRSDG